MSEQPETERFMGMDFVVVHAYTVDMGVADGVLVPLVPEAWESVSAGIPIVVTASLYEQFTERELIEAYNRWVGWFQEVRPTLPEEEQMYTEVLGNVEIWILFDGAAITLLKPSEY